MVQMAERLDLFKSREARWLAAGLGALAAAVGAVMAARGIDFLSVALALHGAAALGIAVAWRQAWMARQEGLRTLSDISILSRRLMRIERQLQQPEEAGDPALRSTMAGVTGQVGLLGGVVRELARNVAVQNRDVADLKSSLTGVESRAAERSPLRVVPEPRLAAEPVPSRPVPPAEPSLLPLRQRATEGDRSRLRLVTQAFEADRVELHLQPVVSLPQRKVRFYEALARLRLADGTIVGPTEFLPHLDRLGRTQAFDRLVVGRAIAVARHLVERGSEAIVTVNLSPLSVAEPGLLWSLLRLLESAPEVVGRVVLEVPQQSWRSLGAEQEEAIRGLRDRGIPLALDRATDLDFDARTLADRGVRFLKLPADLLLAASDQDDCGICARDFAPLLLKAGIKLVAERVEREETVPDLIELGVPLAQGFVFAAPRAVRSEVLDGAAPAGASRKAEARLALHRAG